MMLRLNMAPMLRGLAILAVASAACLPAMAPAMAQTPVPTATAAPASVPASERNFVVFFKEWSAAFDEPALAVIAAAAKMAKVNPDDSVVVTGYADLVGSARANALISALRAEQVFDALVEAGIKPERIQRVAEGSTTFVFAAQESRRVTISVGVK